MRKGKKNKGKVEKSNAGNYKPRLTSAKEEETGAINDESREDVAGVKNLAGDDFDRKFEMMLVCLLIFVYVLGSK